MLSEHAIRRREIGRDCASGIGIAFNHSRRTGPITRPHIASALAIEDRSDMLLIASHSKLPAHESACRSNLLQQFQAALAGAGLQPHNVLCITNCMAPSAKQPKGP